MTSSKAIKIYLASSITELEKERKDISDSISQDLTTLFEKDDIIIQFLRCDSIHSGNIGKPDQERIDEMLCKCDVSLFLFKDKEGEYTLHEYDVARALQKEKKHEIFVYYLPGSEGKKDERLTPFQERMKADGVYWKESNNLMEMKYDFAMGLLKHLGVQLGGSIQATEEVKKDGDALFEQLEQNKLQMHQEIEKLLAQIDPIMDDENSSIAAKITQVIGIYQKADLWASKTDYDKKKYDVLLFNYAQFLYKYGLYRDSEAVYLRQIPLAEELYGTEHEKTATSYNEIGGVYDNQGDYPKALEYYFKALKINKKLLGTENKETATNYNNIGLVYKKQGDYPNALEYYFKALKIVKKELGAEHPNTASTYNNIGVVYKEQGDYPKALEYYFKALEIHEKVLGTDHPSTATDYNNIGLVYWKQGDYPKALEYYFKALEIYENKLGKEHSLTAGSYNNIGLVYKKQGDYSKALEYYFKALKIFEKVLGTDHPNTATTYNNIGSVYWNQGDYPKALEYYFKALKIREKVLGTDHPDTATSYNNIGSLYYTTKEYDEALEYLNKALEILEKRLGPNHPYTKGTRGWIDLVHAAMREGHGNCSFFQRLKSFFKL